MRNKRSLFGENLPCLRMSSLFLYFVLDFSELVTEVDRVISGWTTTSFIIFRIIMSLIEWEREREREWKEQKKKSGQNGKLIKTAHHFLLQQDLVKNWNVMLDTFLFSCFFFFQISNGRRTKFLYLKCHFIPRSWLMWLFIPFFFFHSRGRMN